MRKRDGKKHKGYNRTVYQSLALISQFGINMLVPIFLLSFLGIFLDRRLHTSYWMVVLFFAGALAGLRNTYLMAKKIYEAKDKNENRKKKD